MLVKVFRAQEFNTAEIEIEKINTASGSVKWTLDRGLNGNNIPTLNYILQCYIPYSLAVEYGLASGQHSSIAQEAKIFLYKKDNMSPKYIEGYKYLCEQAGQKPSNKSGVKSGRTPCTKKILQILDGQKLLREDIKNRLIELGYDESTVCNTLKSLEKQNRVRIFRAGSYKKWEVEGI